MTIQDAIALQPMWVQIWLKLLFFSAFILPITLVIWRGVRLAGVLIVMASFASAVVTRWMFSEMGYVRLLGLPHLVFWTPVSMYLLYCLRQTTVPILPRLIGGIVLGAIAISLAFDFADVVRYLLGERAPQNLGGA